jgi:hypothetical protein
MILMKAHNWIRAGTLVFALGATAFVGYGKYRDHQMEHAHQRRVSEMADRFKACPERFRSGGDCHTREERESLGAEADRHREAGEYEQAGLIYASIGREDDARYMAGMLARAGREEARERILYELRLRSEAGARAREPAGR